MPGEQELSAQAPRDACQRISQELGFDVDPVIQMLWLSVGHDQAFDAQCKRLNIPNPYGKHDERKGPRLDKQTGEWLLPGMIALAQRIDCLKAAAPFIHPRKAAVAVTSDDDDDRLDARAAAVERLAQDPEMRAVMERTEQRLGELLDEGENLTDAA